MAINIEYQIDEKVLADDRQAEPTVVDPAIIETTYFMLPIRINIGGEEILKTKSNAWVPQPLLGFATHLVHSLEAIRSTHVATCSISGGTLRFRRRGERVRLTCSYNGVEVETAFNELEIVVRIFQEKVEKLLRAQVPEIVLHPSWTTWFPQKSELIRVKSDDLEQ